MLKILHIDSERGWRGGQQQAAYLIEGLLKRGYETEVICQPESAFEMYCIENGIPHTAIRMRGEIDFFAARKISAICRKQQYQILHLHSAHAVATGLWVKLFYKKIKLIGVRRVISPLKKNFFSRFKYRTEMIEKHVCISAGIKNVMMENGVSEKRLVVIHSGIDLKKFDHLKPDPALKKEFGIPEDHIIVGTVAALSSDKDYPNLLKAARKIISENENVTFCAVGTGPDEKKIHQMAEDLDLGSRFIFTGYRSDVGSFLKIFDVFVLASMKEGLGTSLLDAQTCGLPLIGCNVGGIPEIISNEKNGLLVEAGNPQALSDAINKLVADKALRQRFGMAGKESVRFFDVEKTINRNIKLYRKINNEICGQLPST